MHRFVQYAVTTAFVCPLYLVTIILGSLGTGLVIHAYVTDKARHKAFNFLLTNLAIGDLIICALFTPLLFCYRVHETAGIIGYTPLCELGLFLSMFSTSLIFLVLPLLAYCRKDAILQPEHPKLSVERARTVTRLFWVLSILSGVMMVLISRCDMVNSGSVFPHLYRCLLINQSLDLYAQVFLGYSIPLFGLSIMVTVVIYIQIYFFHSSPGVNLSSEEWQITKLCFRAAVVYIVCWIPFVLVQIFGVLGTYTERLFNLHGMSSAIGVLGSALSSWLYIMEIPYYKAKMERVLFRQGLEKKE